MAEKRNIAIRDQHQERAPQRPVVSPAVDIYEDADEIVLVADLPGVADGNVQLQFEKEELRIEASTSPAPPDWSPLFREFAQRDYQRTFQLTPGIDVSKITAELKTGSLTVHLPKAAALKPRQIAIKSG